MAYSKRALGLDPSLWAAIPHDLNKKMMDLSHKSGVSLLLLPPPSQPWSITALPFGQCQIILLGNRGSHVWTSCPRSLHDNERPGVEPATSRSLVRFHHYTPHNAVAIPQSGTEKKWTTMQSVYTIYVNCCSTMVSFLWIRIPETIKLISFVILFMLNILCDVIHDVIDHRWTCLCLTDLTDRAIGQFQKWLASVIGAKSTWTYWTTFWLLF